MAKVFDIKALREKVMASDDVQHDTVFVEKWDVELPVRTLMGADLKKVMKYKDDPIRMTCLAVIYGTVTEDGERVFAETDLAKFESDKSFKALAEVAKRIFELSGLDEQAAAEAKND
jgi:hypothetical protein